MPYTPPSHRSPASSAPTSPDVSRRSSFHNAGSGSNSAASSRPALPRSASYLTKHRRTPSASPAVVSPPATLHRHGSTPDITPPGTSDDLKGMVASQSSPSVSIRQSPPPVTNTRAMPPGAIISPPESSSEDEGAAGETRGRQIENLKELQDAISIIPQHRESSPNRTSPGDLLVLPSQVEELVEGARKALTEGTSIDGTSSAAARRISHARSTTEPSIFISKSAEASLTGSDEDSDQDEPLRKPQMVRKKSGELVRPALRPASHRRPSSMPGTPTFSKAVHFDSHLEHVRHFLQVDRPLAVSAGSSPADNYESDTEYPFAQDEKSGTRSPPYEWEIVINNFPTETPIRKALPARVERLWMSNDQKCLIGSVAVANLAFQKSVVCRFTFDYWKTTSEVAAEFTHEIRPKETGVSHDRFQFTIKLSDMANLESKTLFFCVRYNVNGLEYWDNNNNLNFQVDFKKKHLPQNGKNNFQGAGSKPINALPRSTRRSNQGTSPRPKSMPVGALDDFQEAKFLNFDQPIHEYLGEAGPIRLKTSKSTSSVASDNLSSRLSTPSGQAFANRYDFGASLSAAMQAHKDSLAGHKDGLYMKSHKRATFAPVLDTSVSKVPTSSSSAPKVETQLPEAPAASISMTTGTVSGPTLLGTDSPSSASIASSSYEEILNKYCFFNGSKQSSPQARDGTLRSSRYDGPSDEFYTHSTTNSTNSSNGSPDTAADRSSASHAGLSLHHQLRQHLNPYFQNNHLTKGASPAESPNSSGSNMPGMAGVMGALGTPPASSPHAKSSSTGSSVSHNFAGTSPSNFASGNASPFHSHQHVQDRFPFTAETHTSPAIRG